MIALDDLRRRLTDVPDPHLPPDASVEYGIAESVRYLGSNAALRSFEADIYWPKWGSPWWHMLLLFELGEARRIPERVVAKMTEALAAFPIEIFPVHDGDLLPTVDPNRDVRCHCALGSMVQILAACGRDVDRELPWIEPWFVRYQMADGGLNCDDTAYRCEDECPSSMVATIAPFEAMLLGRRGAFSPEHAAFVERAAGFLIERRLMLGSPTRHNAQERVSEVAWLEPCFPRFYFYDVVRGLAALVRWAEVADLTYEPVLAPLRSAFPCRPDSPLATLPARIASTFARPARPGYRDQFDADPPPHTAETAIAAPAGQSSLDGAVSSRARLQ